MVVILFIVGVGVDGWVVGTDVEGNKDGEPVGTVLVGELVGDVDGSPEGDDEGDGDDLHEEGYVADYRALPLLDTYEGRGIDRREYERISEDARLAAEAEMRQRDRSEMRHKGVRLPLALQDTDDEGSELEPS